MKLIFMIPLKSIKTTLAVENGMCVYDSTISVIYEFATKLLDSTLDAKSTMDQECFYAICSGEGRYSTEEIDILYRVLQSEFSCYFKDIENLITLEGEDYKELTSIHTDIVGHGRYFKIEVNYPED